MLTTCITGQLVLIVKPGPDLTCTIATALQDGKTRATTLMFGLVAGCWFWTLAAFHAGLAENVSALAALLAADTVLYGHGYGAVELRGLMARRDSPSFIDRTALVAQLHCILDLAEDGLRKPGFHG